MLSQFIPYMTYPIGKGLFHAHPFTQFALSAGLRRWYASNFCGFPANFGNT